MATESANDHAKQAGKWVKKTILKVPTKTRKGKFAKEIAAPVVGALTEVVVVVVVKKGPEIASKGVKLVKKKAPLVTARAKDGATRLTAKIKERRSRSTKGSSSSTTPKPPEVVTPDGQGGTADA